MLLMFLKSSENLFYKNKGNSVEPTGMKQPLFYSEAMETLKQIMAPTVGKSGTILLVWNSLT